MRQLSATEAIAPAWNHTRNLLDLRNWRLLLKIGAVAFFAQMGGCNANFNTHGGKHWPGMPPAFTGALVLLALIFGVVALAVAAVFFYLGSRLQFVLFEVVLRRDTTIAPIWNRYGKATWYWMALKLLFLLVALVCAALILGPSILHFIHHLPAHPAGGRAGAIFVLKAMVRLFLPILFTVLLVFSAYRLLYDFGLPSMALDSTSLGGTVERILHLVRAQPAQVMGYLAMYFLLGIAGGITNILLIVAVIGIALVPLGGGAWALWFALRHAGIAGYAVIGLGCGVAGMALLAIILLTVLASAAYLHCFLQAYALYFLGGRYPRVGEYLEPAHSFEYPPATYPQADTGFPPQGEPSPGT